MCAFEHPMRMIGHIKIQQTTLSLILHKRYLGIELINLHLKKGCWGTFAASQQDL